MIAVMIRKVYDVVVMNEPLRLQTHTLNVPPLLKKKRM